LLGKCLTILQSEIRVSKTGALGVEGKNNLVLVSGSFNRVTLGDGNAQLAGELELTCG